MAWAVEAAARRIPKATCLAQGMAMHVLLRRLGEPSELRMGVARNSNGQFEAHAWVETQGLVVIGGAIENFHRFARLKEQTS
jgi:hypothetical protein